MPNAYTQIHIQIVFAVRFRESLIPRRHKEEVQKYIAGIIRNYKHKLLAINCMPDHTHIFLGLHPDQSLSDLVREIKSSSAKFVNEMRWGQIRFHWQEGYGAFSYARTEVDRVIQYILNQEEHHRKKSFREEYLEALREFKIEYEERYLFNWEMERGG